MWKLQEQGHESELQDALQLLQRLPEPYLLLGPRGEIAFGNDSFLETFSLPRAPKALQELLGGRRQDCSRCLHEWAQADVLSAKRLRLQRRDRVESWLGYGARLVEAGGRAWIVLRLQPRARRSHEEQQLSHRVAELERELGRYGRLECELRELETRARQASQAKDRLLADVSHEVRTPMSGILGMAELLLESGLNAQQLEFANTIRCSTQNLLAIVNSILDWSALEARGDGKKMLFDPLLLAEEAMELLALRAPLTTSLLVLGGERIPRRVQGDAGALRQVLLNLVSNAIEFTPKGHVAIRCGWKAGRLSYTVEDSGTGISAEHLERIFHPFQQVEEGRRMARVGTGLGLSISRRIVSLMGGEMAVESLPGEGTVFCFTVPAPADGSAETIPPPDRGTALWVGGEESLVTEVLEETGFRVKSCSPDRLPGDLSPFRLVVCGNIDQATTLDGRPEVAWLCHAAERSALTLARAPFSRCLCYPLSRRRLESMLAHEERDAPPSAFNSVLPSGLKVVLVDDNPVSQRVGVLQLEKLGNFPRTASNGRQLLELLERDACDLVLLDLQMPVMDGYQAAAEIRRQPDRYGRPVLIALTAHVGRQDRQRCLEAGFDDYLTKPADGRALANVLQRWTRDRF